MRIHIASVLVDDQERAHRFYTEILGFQTKVDIPLGDHRWLTVVSPEDPEGTQLLLEPNAHPAVPPFQAAMLEDGIPWTSFAVTDVESEYARLVEHGVTFTQPPVDHGPVITAVFEDTCGNLLQIEQRKEEA